MSRTEIRAGIGRWCGSSLLHERVPGLRKAEAVAVGTMLWEETLRGNATWSHVLKRGTSVRITALADGANVGAYMLNADQPAERLNLPDTLKAQHIARLTAGSVLYSDMGRVLCSITEDTLGWHDPLGGCSDAAMVERKYGRLTYQQARNDWHQNALDGFRTELEKYALGPRDLGMNVNLFSKVEIADSGEMRFRRRCLACWRCGPAACRDERAPAP